MKKKIIITLAVIISLVVILATVALSRPTPKLLKNYASEEELMSVLDKEDFEQLKNEVNEAGDNYKYEELIHYAYAIKNKISEIPADILTELITSKLNAVNLRYLLLDICDNEFAPIILDYDKLVKMITDTEENETLRSFALIYLNQPYTYAKQEGFSDILYSLCFDKSKVVSEFALQGLYFNERQKAIPVIKTILYEDTDNFGPKVVNRAISYMAQEFRDHSSEYTDGKEQERYFKFCTDMLNENKYCNGILYGLIDANSIDAVKIVLSSPHSREGLKLYCVSQNYYAIRDWVYEGGVTKEKAEYFLECLNYFPAKQAVTDLQTILSESPELFSNENDSLKERLTSKLEYLKTNGTNIFGERD